MSGTASRFQTRFAYGPALRVGNYPGAAPVGGPLAPAPAAPVPGAPAPVMQAPVAQQPQQQAQAPVSAGSIVPSPGNEGARGDDIGSKPDGSLSGLGPNPGTLSGFGGLAGLGFGTGGWGGTLGSLAGSLIGGPIGGVIGYGLGSMFNQSALEGRIGEVFSPSRDLTSGGLGSAAPGTGATVSDPYGGIAVGSGFGKGSPSMDGGAKDAGKDFGGLSQSDLGGDAGKSGPGSAPDGGQKGDFGGDGGTSAGDTGGGGYGGADSSDSPGGDGDGWKKGGYTGPGGDGVVQPDQPAGTVHEGEVVIPAAMVARYGLRPLMALVHGDVAPSKLASLARG